MPHQKKNFQISTNHQPTTSQPPHIINMKLTLEEIYQLTKKSLQEKEYWQWNQHYYTYKKGAGIPYEITNEKIGITIWIANDWTSLYLKTNEKFNTGENKPPSITPSRKLPPINLYKRWILYRLAMKLFTDTEFDIDIDEQLSRDIKLKKLLK